MSPSLDPTVQSLIRQCQPNLKIPAYSVPEISVTQIYLGKTEK